MIEGQDLAGPLFGVIAFDSPYGLYNLGDEVQTLAAEALLPRVDVRLQREELDTARSDRPIHTVMNGWFMHTPSRWPPSPAIRPLITSFHVARQRGASGEEATPSEVIFGEANLAYLRRWAPIGCRDLDTLERCRAAAIPAYFSGCLTLTLDRPDVPRDEELVVLNDVPTAVVEHVRHRTNKDVLWTAQLRSRSADREGRFATARRLIGLYARASCVVTTRLHCALPCLAVGTPVLLLDEQWDQYRFSGLNDLLQHAPAQAFLSGQVAFNVDAPPPPRTDHLPLARELRARVAGFVTDAYAGVDVPND